MAISMPYVLCSKVNLFLIVSRIIGSGFISDPGTLSKNHKIDILFAVNSSTQHMQLFVRCTHQSMPIIRILSWCLRMLVPTVGTIHLITFKEVTIQNTISIVMEHNSYWLIPSLDSSSFGPGTTMSRRLTEMGSCCSYFPQESP